MKITKSVKWEAGHRLAKEYPGNCQHVHGHSYVATIEMTLVEGSSLNKYGFVKDFNDFKTVKKWIDDNWDHAFLVASDDIEMREFLDNNKQRQYVFNTNPTAEYIAQKLFDVSADLLNDYCSKVTKVIVNETATSEAIYEKEELKLQPASIPQPQPAKA